MAPKKPVDQVEARHGNSLAVKQEVSMVDIIAALSAIVGPPSEPSEVETL